MDNVSEAGGLFERHWPINRCPQCGTHKPNLSMLYEVSTGISTNQINRAWGIFVCAHCFNLTMIETTAVKMCGHWVLRNSSDFRSYPPLNGVSEDVPETPRRYLTQAINSVGSPDASVIVCASAVDAMLKLKGFTEGSLHSRIRAAVAQNLMTQSMADWANEVRLAANDQRHADAEAVHASTSDAKRLIAFAMALADFLFVFPARIYKGRASSS